MQKNTESNIMCSEYAETIIHDPELYFQVEVCGVRDISELDAESTCCEVDNENPQFYSAYARLHEGECECIGDFSRIEDARQYAKKIAIKYGWKIRDWLSTSLPASSQEELISEV